MSDDEFELFGELTTNESAQLLQLQSQGQDRIQRKLKTFSPDRQNRTTAQNRFVFHHQSFQTPIVHPTLLTPIECDQILQVCRARHDWTTARHSAFATTDIPIRPDPDLAYLEDLLKDRLFEELAAHYGFRAQELAFRDLFLVKYQADAQRGLKLHTDGCLFSLTLLVSRPQDFVGGGTYFKSVDRVIHLKQGDCAYHDARVFHSGVDITQGERYVLVAFIDTFDTINKDKRAMLRS